MHRQLCINRFFTSLYYSIFEHWDFYGRGRQIHCAGWPAAVEMIATDIDILPDADDRPHRIEELRVLVVDQEPNMRKLIRTFLRSLGVEKMLEAACAEEALTLLRAKDVDLLLSECLLKPVDGFSLVRQIRGGAEGISDELPIIMMSGQTSRQQIIDARNIGANEFVAKPLSVKVLRQRLEAIVERPRPFVRTRKYTGPCRRRHAAPDYAGPERRGNDEATEMSQDDINDLLDSLA